MKSFVSIVVIFFIAVAILWPLKIQPYLKIKKLQATAEKEEVLQIEKLKQEYERMSALASNAHEKCPTSAILRSNISAYNKRGMNQIPAYPHLSDIYLYILPPMAREFKTIKDEKLGRHINGYEYSPLTETKIEKFRHRLREQGIKPTLAELTASRLLEQLQKNAITPVIIEAIENSLAYCALDENGIPKKVKLVQTPLHDNLEQKDALTVVAGALYREESPPAHPMPNNLILSLHTAQYIPRWKVFPAEYTDVKSDGVRVHSIWTYGFRRFDGDPYSFAQIDARNNLGVGIPYMRFNKDVSIYYTPLERKGN